MNSERLVDEAVQLLPQLVRRMHASYSEYAESGGLTLGQMKTLSYLYHNGRSTIGEVAEGLGLAMPTASELIDKLAERDLVAREINPNNRRQVLVWLTESATIFGQDVYEKRRAQIRQAFTGLDPGEQEIVIRGLRALCEAVGPTSSSSSPSDAAMAPCATPVRGIGS